MNMNEMQQKIDFQAQTASELGLHYFLLWRIQAIFDNERVKPPTVWYDVSVRKLRFTKCVKYLFRARQKGV